MKRPLVWVAVAVLFAVLTAATDRWWYTPVFLIALSGVATIEYCRNSKDLCFHKALIYIMRCIIIISIIYFGAYLYGTASFRQSLIDSLINENNKIETTVNGTVENVSKKDYGIVLVMSKCKVAVQSQFQSQADTITTDKEKILVTLYDDMIKEQHLSSIEPGDLLIFEGDIAKFQSPRNEGEFNAKNYYNSLGIKYKVTAQNVTSVTKVSGVQAYINKLKNRMDAVYELVADESEAGVLKAIVLGDKDCLDDDLYELYQKNGIAHILAISGLHISFIGMMIYKVFKRLLSGYIVPFTASMTVLLLYAVMTGSGVSAKRAVIMCIVSMGADVLGRTYDVLSALSLSAILLIAENVSIIYNPSFLLSFGAIIGIAVICPAFNKLFVEPLDKAADRLDRKRQIGKRQAMKGLVIVLGNFFSSISVSLVTLPIIMYQYFEVPVYSVFLNIIVIPLMSLLLLCAMIVAVIGMVSLPMATFFMGTVHYILKLYTFLCNIFERIPGNIWVTGQPEITDCIVYYIILGVFVLLVTLRSGKKTVEKLAKKPVKKPVKKSVNTVAKESVKQDFKPVYIAIVGIALIILIPPKEDNLVIRMIDVGQGDCIFIQYKEETYLFDGGSTDVSNVGERRIYSCLRANGVTCIDYIFVSHADTDHISGVLELLNMQDSTFCIKNLVLPNIKDKASQESFMELVKAGEAAGVNVLYVKRGDCYRPDHNLSLICMHPSVDYDYDSSNDYSAVYKLSYGDFSMLLTGDVEKAGEQAILDSEVEQAVSNSNSEPATLGDGNLDVDVLKVAHHGSKNSSCTEILEAVTPAIALISCGVDNFYGHPHEDTLKRLKNAGAKVYVTAQCGQITIKVLEQKIVVKQMLD